VLVNAALREARALELGRALVADCLSLDDPIDARFHRAWTESLATLPRAERGGALTGVTGHVAESVVAVLSVDRDHELSWQFVGPGRHGVDVVMFTPDGRVVGIEVKATLRPRERSGELGAGRDSELREDAVEVGADRAVREVEALADLAVGEPFGREVGDLQLLCGQLVAGVGCAALAGLARGAQRTSRTSRRPRPGRRTPGGISWLM
jgi:hypothetical protein